MKLFLSTLLLAFCLTLVLGLYAQNSTAASVMPDTAEGMEVKTGHKMETSPNATKAPYDLQFLDTMALHHRSAVTMAELAAERTQHPDLKSLSNQIITLQKAEMAEMAKLRAEIYPASETAENMEMVGMKTSLEDMDIKKLQKTEGTNFDKLYIQMMVTHHRGGIAMATDASKKLADARINKLAQAIIAEQTEELQKFKEIYKELQ